MWEMEQGYPGIQIIEATPKSSPCPSERQTHCKDHIKMLDRFKRKRHDDNSIDSITEYPDENHHQYRSSDPRELSEDIVLNSNNSNTPQSKTLMCSDNISHQPVIRRAPLASLSSFKMSSIECQDSEDVFDESCADTDDDVDMEQFSTDSDEISLQSPPTTDRHVPVAVNGRHESRLVKHCDVVIENIDKNDNVKSDDQQEPINNNKAENSLKEPCESTERQRSNDKISTATQPASYTGISSSTSDKKSNSSECVTINLVECKSENVEKSPIKPSAPSSVILEMPILAMQNDETSPCEAAAIVNNQEPDPSVVTGASARKWSKETLF